MEKCDGHVGEAESRGGEGEGERSRRTAIKSRGHALFDCEVQEEGTPGFHVSMVTYGFYHRRLEESVLEPSVLAEAEVQFDKDSLSQYLQACSI